MPKQADLGLTPWIRRLAMRSVLTREQLGALAALPFERAFYDTNRDFVRLGECTAHACVILSGLAGRFDQTASGARQITALHIPGDAADLHSTPLPKASNALQALTRTEIAHIPHDALRALAGDQPATAMAFWRDCMVDAAILSKWALNMGRASARQRIAHILCELSLRYRVIGKDADRFDFPATQIHLGDATGLSNVHVNRILRELSGEGLVTIKAGRVEIGDRKRLWIEGDFDPAYLHLPAATV